MTSIIGFGTFGVTGSGASYELHDDGSSRIEVWMATGARASLELSPADTAALAGHLAELVPPLAAPAEAVAPEPANPAPAAAEPVEEAEPVEAESAPAEEPDA